MADIDVVEKPTGTQTWVWALVAVLAVAGLFTWLAIQSERATTTAIIQEEETPAPAAPGVAPADAEPAELAAVAAAPEPFVGRQVYIEDVEVAAPLGPSAFWGDVPGANPFLVLFSPNVTVPAQISAGQTYNVQGVINAVNDSLLNVWVESGAIRPAARDEAAFATHYLLAEQIVR